MAHDKWNNEQGNKIRKCDIPRIFDAFIHKCIKSVCSNDKLAWKTDVYILRYADKSMLRAKNLKQFAGTFERVMQ